jgi:hypothetical protein
MIVFLPYFFNTNSRLNSLAVREKSPPELNAASRANPELKFRLTPALTRP